MEICQFNETDHLTMVAGPTPETLSVPNTCFKTHDAKYPIWNKEEL
jgi:hypothetical protein